MTGGCWILNPKTGEKVAGVRGPDGIAIPLTDIEEPKTKPTKKGK